MMIQLIKQLLVFFLVCYCGIQIGVAQNKKQKEPEAFKIKASVLHSRQAELKKLTDWFIGLKITPPLTNNYAELYTGRTDEKYITENTSSVYLKNIYGHTLYKIRLEYKGKYPYSGIIYKQVEQEDKKYSTEEFCRFSLLYTSKQISKILYTPSGGNTIAGEYVFTYDKKYDNILHIDFISNNQALKSVSIKNGLIDTIYRYNNQDLKYYFAHQYNNQNKIISIKKIYPENSKLYSDTKLLYGANNSVPSGCITTKSTADGNYGNTIRRYTAIQNQTVKSAVHYINVYTNSPDIKFIKENNYFPFQYSYEYNDRNECILSSEKFDHQCIKKVISTSFELDEEGLITSSNIKIKKSIHCR